MHSFKHALICSLLSQTVALQSTWAAPLIGDDDAAKLVKQGEAAAASFDWKAAASSFEQASNSDTWRKTALFDLGVAYCHLGVYAKALDCERQAVVLDEHYVPAYVQMGTILTKMGDYSGAEVALNKALELQPDSKEARSNLNELHQALQANAALKKDEPIKAVKIFDGTETIGAAKNDTPVEIVFPGQKGDAGVATVNAAPEQKKSAITTVVTDVASTQTSTLDQKQAPKPADVASSETDSALMSAADLLKIKPATPAQAPAQPDAAQTAEDAAARARVLAQRTADTIMEATVYFNSGSVDGARITLIEAIKLDGNSSLAHANLGVILGSQGDYEGEIKEERRACELDDKNLEAHLNLAWALAKTKKYAASADEYDKALALDEKANEALAGRAYMLSKTGKKHEALDLLKKARAEQGDKAWPCTTLGAIYADDKRYDDAELALKEALVRDPESSEALRRMAQVSMQHGKWQDAAVKYQALVNKKPYDLDAYLGLAQAKEKAGDKDGAVKALQTAVQIAPNNADVHKSLSTALAQAGHSAEAKKEAHAGQRS